MNEEQIAIETLKEVASEDFDTLGDDISPKMAKNILKLIEKQQKEIDRLNRKQADDEMLKDTFIERDYISKDKIREKIKEIHNEGTFDAEIVLTKLLEEN